MDIIERIDDERTARTIDPNRPANPLLREARDEILRLRAALQPFVTAANDADGYPDNHHIGCDPCMSLEGLTVGDLRRARDTHGT